MRVSHYGCRFLASVVGFDSVDDEGHYDEVVAHKMRLPEQWNDDDKPPYSYCAYYMYANLYTLNKFREMRGLNTFAFRPHCGEAGQPHHLATTFLLAENIQHGINLGMRYAVMCSHMQAICKPYAA